jgi:hypothetical protein
LTAAPGLIPGVAVLVCSEESGNIILITTHRYKSKLPLFFWLLSPIAHAMVDCYTGVTDATHMCFQSCRTYVFFNLIEEVGDGY